MTKKKCTVFDFGDSRGAVPAHQYINPDGTIGGWVADCVEISAGAKVFIGAKVRFSGYLKTFIRGGTFEGGTFRGGTFWGGTFEGGTIKTSRDFIVFACVGSRNDTLTVQFEDEPLFTTGCRTRKTLEEFSNLVKRTHGNNVWGKEYHILIKTVKDIWKIRKAEKEDMR